MLTREHCVWMYDNNCQGTNIFDVYDRPSTAKVNAYKYCREDMSNFDGYDFRITGHNCMKFSCAFRYVDKDTGVEKIRYHTADNVYDYDY